MSKYSLDFKLQVINYCIENYCGYRVCAKHFNIDVTCVKQWKRKYEKFGIDGLVKNKRKYDGNFKLNVIKYMHSNHLSLTQTAIHFNIGCKKIVKKWEQIYYEEGPQALYEERRGKIKNMSSKIKNKLNTEEEENLISEVQRLRMENEYLKKLNALVQERIKRENKKK